LRLTLACLALMALSLACGAEEETVPAPNAETPPASGELSSPAQSSSTAVTDWNSLIQEVADYLTANSGSTDCLAELFVEWNMPSDGTTPCAAADLDGDGDDEYVVRLVRASEPDDSGYPDWLIGNILVFDAGGEGFRPVFDFANVASQSSQTVLSNALIHSVRDLTGDGAAKAILTSGQCGAHTCHIGLYVVGPAGGAYIPLLFVESIPIADDQLRIEDADDDGLPGLRVRSGVVGSAGAGPQRATEWTYRWDGTMFQAASVEHGPPNYPEHSLYFLIRDGDEAFLTGRNSDARELYERALAEPDLTEDGFGDSAELRAYARFRIALTFAAAGENAASAAALHAAVADDPTALHTELARRFLDAYLRDNIPAAGCTAALAFVDENAEAFAKLWDYGYVNPNPGAEKRPLCPF
jgi:hypothetical protein